MSKHPCQGCVDWVTCGGDRICDYIGHTGHARSLICPPGALCTVKSKVTRKPRQDGRKHNGRAYTWDTAKALSMYKQGARDPEIADALGVRREAVWHWRIRQKLTANKK